MVVLGLFKRLRSGLARSARTLADGVKGIFGGPQIQKNDLERLEELLISTDMGVRLASRIRAAADDAVRRGRLAPDAAAVLAFIKQQILETLTIRKSGFNFAESPPTVILVVGVNGTGKTTTVGKLAHFLISGTGTFSLRENVSQSPKARSVAIAACDTFRAAAVEQLAIWAERAGANFLGAQPHQDPGSVLHNAALSAKADGADVLLVDTAGRLHNKEHLMRELDKMARVVQRIIPGAPHETFLVLDATTGQNALSQARTFSQVLPLTGLIIAKLDGTAKGGIALAIYEEIRVPVRFVGIGEKVEDLAEFAPREFVEALFAADADAG